MPSKHTDTSALALDIAADLEPIESSARRIVCKLGRDVHFAVAVASPFDILDPCEEAITEGMALGRRESFVAGRIAIGRALRAAGHPGGPVTASLDGAPILPDGYIGSIAHKHGRALAVAARAAVAAGIGVDLEFDDALDDGDLRASVLAVSEDQQVADLAVAEASLLSPVTLVLAAKEAAYKAAFPLLRSAFDFEEIEVSFDVERRSFRAVRFPGEALLRIDGHYSLAERWIATIAVASRRSANV